MKKRLVTALALMFGLGVGATAFAAANPFVDVPAKHWAYDAVNKLAKAGIVDGYGDGTFRGDRTMTRYEMAQIVAKAMARSDKADAETKATIDKLATEFSAEIENLGVRVAKLEKKSDNLRFDGNLRTRIISNSMDHGVQSTTDREIRYRLGAHAEVNDTWKVHALFEGNLNDNNYGADDNNLKVDEMYAEGALGATTLSVGKFIQKETGDLILDEVSIKGARLGFGNQLKAQVFYGTMNANPATSDDTTNAYGTSLNWAAAKNFSMFGSYTHLKDRNDANSLWNGENSGNAWDAGFNYKFNNDWQFTGVYGATSANEQNKAFKAEFQYKAIDLNKVGTWQAAAGYWKHEANSLVDTGAWVPSIAGQGAKGWYVDGAYVPAKNIKLRGIYGQFKTTTGDDVKDKFTRVQAEFFF
ncbi:S-layer homology domain-containing protein [Anaeromusa acidaminophila]|uniref:S-layer homology domain-containing protein n=1 Tax=Anaeromusa acidaminophila TaxID=81464 RepID=UPI00037649D3|nr:S-layer homology domain-containing protein [Anaeromusa acidaminophila]